MRVTIEIDANKLKQIQRITRQKKKSPAIGQALLEFVRQQRKQRFIERALSGQTDYGLTNEDLERRDVYDPR
jgi:Arc/MetJ family transcription regulator